VLRAIGSDSHRLALDAHTPATRAQLVSEDPSLANAIDDLTHFLTATDLPAERVQHIWVTREDPTASVPVLSYVHVSAAYRAEARALRAAARNADATAPFRTPVLSEEPRKVLTPRDAAKSLIFHHPEIVRLEPKQAAIVLDVIEDSTLIEDLARQIADLGDGWLTATPARGPDGRPVFDRHGQPIIQYDPSDDTLAVAGFVVKDILHRVFNEPALEGANWHVNPGRTTVSQPNAAELAAMPPRERGGFRVAARYAPGSVLHGLVVHDLAVVNPASRRVRLSLKNTWLRYVGAYVEMYDAAGTRLIQHVTGPEAQLSPPYYKPEHDSPVKHGRFLSVLGSNIDFLGFVLPPERLAPTELEFDVPAEASSARVVFGSLGIGGEVIEDYGTLGAVVTLIANIGIPTLLTALAVGRDTNLDLADIFTKPTLWLDVIRREGFGIYVSVKADNAVPALIQTGKLILSIALDALPALASRLAALIGSEQLEEAVPVVGWGIKLLRLQAGARELTTTITEVLSGPALFDNRIDLTMDTMVTIHRDPRDFQFPATATRYVLRAVYDKSNEFEITGKLPTGRSAPIEEVFRDVPSGGKAKIDVWFLTDNNWIAGHGTTGTYDNLPDVASERAITIEENLVPLTAMTQYTHRQKLGYANGHYRWEHGAAPTATDVDLNCDDETLCSLDAITVSQDIGAVGYAWRAAAPSTPICGTSGGASSLHRVQNLSLTENPEAALKIGRCGYAGKAALAYELLAPKDRPGRYFYLEPAVDGFHLRAIAPDQLGPFDMQQTMSWGRFTVAIDAMAVHHSGYVFGVSAATHKLEIIALPDAARPDAGAIVATIKAGRGARDGLLDTPIAVGVDRRSGAVLVLEAGNARVQAFDVYGNPLERFTPLGSTTKRATLALHDEPGADVTYLDLAVESTGFLYVLSYQHEGTTPADYRVDLYDPDGRFLSRTVGVAAGRLAVDVWRNLFTLNYAPIVRPSGPEPSISEWVPSTPDGCTQEQNPFCQRK
jgi:hypothetical protein